MRGQLACHHCLTRALSYMAVIPGFRRKRMEDQMFKTLERLKPPWDTAYPIFKPRSQNKGSFFFL